MLKEQNKPKIQFNLLLLFTQETYLHILASCEENHCHCIQHNLLPVEFTKLKKRMRYKEPHRRASIILLWMHGHVSMMSTQKEIHSAAFSSRCVIL